MMRRSSRQAKNELFSGFMIFYTEIFVSKLRPWLLKGDGGCPVETTRLGQYGVEHDYDADTNPKHDGSGCGMVG